MAIIEQLRNGDGSTLTGFTFTFPSYKVEDIKVAWLVNDVWTDKTVTTHYTIVNYTPAGGGEVQFTSGNAPASATGNVRIYRDTEVDTVKATYQAGSSITADDLNNNFNQGLYALQELKGENIDAARVMTGAITTVKLYSDAVTGDKLADDSVNSEHYVDGSIDTAHIADSQITTAKLAADAITGAKIADDAINSEHYTDGSIDTAHIADSQVTTAKIAADAITGAKIADDAIDSEHYVDGSIDTAHIADDAVTTDKLANSINTAIDANTAKTTNATHTGDVTGSGALTIATGAVTTAKLAADAVDGTKLADDAINSEHYVDASIDTAHIADSQVTTAKIADDAITIAKVGCEQTTISDSDSHVPTSGAVVDYVSTQISAIGGFETIATDAVFPNTQPNNGIVISIADAGGLVVNGSGVSTTGRTVGGSTVTINGINSQFYSTTVAAGVAFMVESTGSGHIYNYHKATLKEADLINLSSDIEDFGNRYRVAGSAPGSNNDEGDLYFDTSTNKMYVYDGSAWGQVTSTGEFKILGVKDNGQAHNGSGPTFNGSNDQYDLFESTSDANLTQASQLIVVLNGVVQKPNDGSFSGSEEGFYLDGTDGIRFCDPPPSGSTLFVTKCGSATSIAVPADNSVTAGKTDISLIQGDIIYGNGTDSWTRLAKGTAGQVLKMNSGATAPEWGTDANDNTQLTEEQVEDFVGGMVTGNTETGITVTYEDSDGTLDFVVDDTTKMPLAGGTFTGDVVFDNAANAGRDLSWNDGEDKLKFEDSTKAVFGTGNDFQIQHNGSNTVISNDTGQIQIKADQIRIISGDASEDILHTNKDGAVKLYYDNVLELETKSGGVKLNGHSESVITALTSASSVTIDFSLSNHFSCTMGHNITFANPSTESVGQSGTIVLTQDGTGSRTASWGSQFLWAGGTAPTLSTAANAVDRIDYFVAAADKIHCVASLAMA